MTNPNTSIDVQWYVARDGKRFGPIEDSKFNDLVKRGQVQGTDLIWRQGFKDWVEAKNVPGLLTGTAELSQKTEPVLSTQSESPSRANINVHSHTSSQTGGAERSYPQSQTKTRTGAGYPVNPAVGAGATVDRSREPQLDVGDQPRFMRTPGFRGAEITGSGWLRKIAFGFAVILFMGIIAIVALPFLVPADFIQERIASIVKSQTGRDFVVKGRTSFSFFPNIGVELNDVSLSNPAGMAGEPLADISVLNINLKLMPLLNRQIEIDHVILKKPKIALRLNRDGQANWTFTSKRNSAKNESSRHTQLAFGSEQPGISPLFNAFIAPASAASTDGRFAGVAIQDLKLGTALIKDGILSYVDEKNNVAQKAENINVSLRLPQLSKPLNANGDLVWKKEKIDFVANVKSIEAFLAGKPSELSLTVESKPVSGNLSGLVSFANGYSFEGTGTVSSNSVRYMTNWLEVTLPENGGFGPFSLQSKVEVRPQILTFTKAKLKLDETTATGEGRLVLSGARPYVKADLEADQLDLNLYFSGASDSARRDAIHNQTRDQKSLTNLIEKISSPERASTTGSIKQDRIVKKKSDQSSDQRFEALKSANFDLKLKFGKLVVKSVKLNQSDVNLRLRDGLLDANLNKIQLYGGSGTGEFKLDARPSVPTFSSVMKLSDLSALPFLKDAATFDWISGRANMVMDITGTGKTETEMRTSLQGKGTILFEDGAIEGVNIPRMLRSLQNGRISGWSREPSLKTDFSKLSATFVMKDGVARNNDLELTSPLLRLTGAGNVDVGGEQLNYVAKPKLVASLEGQGQNVQNDGLEIPVRIEGPWANPRISPDIEGIANDPSAVIKNVDQASEVIKKLKKNKDFESMINGVLGGQSNKGESGGSSFNAEKILEQLNR